jgi:translation initiation factor IF-1
MCKKEIIRLDATVQGVISESVFRAVLANGHKLVAFAGQEDRDKVVHIRPGDTIRVRMSPYDMSVGQIVWDSEIEANT